MGKWSWLSRSGQALPVTGIGPATSYSDRAGAYGHAAATDPAAEPSPAAAPEHRDNRRPRRFPAVPGSGRGQPGVPHLTGPAFHPIPIVAEGTELHLRPGEWSHLADRPPTAYVDLTVSSVHVEWARPSDDMVWVSGHELSCRWPSVERHPPCTRLLVRLDALRRAVGGS